jgi:hypothetical protein
LIVQTAVADKEEHNVKKPENNFKIRPAQPADQKTIRNLLLGYKLPLDGLEGTKLWVLQMSGGEVVGVAGLELYSNQGLLRSVAVVDGLTIVAMELRSLTM